MFTWGLTWRLASQDLPDNTFQRRHAVKTSPSSSGYLFIFEIQEFVRGAQVGDRGKPKFLVSTDVGEQYLSPSQLNLKFSGVDLVLSTQHSQVTTLLVSDCSSKHCTNLHKNRRVKCIACEGFFHQGCPAFSSEGSLCSVCRVWSYITAGMAPEARCPACRRLRRKRTERKGKAKDESHTLRKRRQACSKGQSTPTEETSKHSYSQRLLSVVSE